MISGKELGQNTVKISLLRISGNNVEQKIKILLLEKMQEGLLILCTVWIIVQTIMYRRVVETWFCTELIIVQRLCTDGL